MKHTVTSLLALFLIILGLSGSFAGDYLVGAGDILRITVYDHPDMQTTVRVDDQGYITMPLLDRVKVGDMTIAQISQKLAEQLSDGYIVNPQVNIFVEEFRSKKAVILGHVRHPGLVELSGSTTFLELLSKVGGLTDDAGETATIKRTVNGKSKSIVINLNSLIDQGDLSSDVVIRNGDNIFVSKAATCYVTGQVEKPDAYPCKKETTVMKLITMAGGFTGIASKSGVMIERIVDGKKTIMKGVSLDTAVQADDIIVVPESFF